MERWIRVVVVAMRLRLQYLLSLSVFHGFRADYRAHIRVMQQTSIPFPFLFFSPKAKTPKALFCYIILCATLIDSLFLCHHVFRSSCCLALHLASFV